MGPLSTSLGGIKLFMKTVLAGKPWRTDPSLIPMPWRDTRSLLELCGRTKLKIAVLWDDGVVKPHPPITRALTEVIRKLNEFDDVEVVRWEPYKHDLAWELIVSSDVLPH